MSVFNIPVSMECAFLDREEEFHIAKVPFTELDGQLVTEGVRGLGAYIENL